MTYDELKNEIFALTGFIKQLPESVQLRAFELLTDKLLEDSGPPPPSRDKSTPTRRDASVRKDVPVRERKSARKHASTESYHIERELNLRGDKSIPGFKAFVEDKNELHPVSRTPYLGVF